MCECFTLDMEVNKDASLTSRLRLVRECIRPEPRTACAMKSKAGVKYSEGAHRSGTLYDKDIPAMPPPLFPAPYLLIRKIKEILQDVKKEPTE